MEDSIMLMSSLVNKSHFFYLFFIFIFIFIIIIIIIIIIIVLFKSTN